MRLDKRLQAPKPSRLQKHGDRPVALQELHNVDDEIWVALEEGVQCCLLRVRENCNSNKIKNGRASVLGHVGAAVAEQRRVRTKGEQGYLAAVAH